MEEREYQVGDIVEVNSDCYCGYFSNRGVVTEVDKQEGCRTFYLVETEMDCGLDNLCYYGYELTLVEECEE